MADEPKKAVAKAEIATEAPTRRVTPIEFFKQVRGEAKKVTWPSWKETWLTTVMVFIMVGVTMVFFGVVDVILGYAERLLIGAVHLW